MYHISKSIGFLDDSRITRGWPRIYFIQQSSPSQPQKKPDANDVFGNMIVLDEDITLKCREELIIRISAGGGEARAPPISLADRSVPYVVATVSGTEDRVNFIPLLRLPWESTVVLSRA